MGQRASIIADRRTFHRHPELGFAEHRTARIVAHRLAAIGVDLVVTGVAGTGVVGVLAGTASRRETEDPSTRCVLLRADMDALPLQEAADPPYKSRHAGRMHACGHDAHVAILLAVARVLGDLRDQFAGTVKFVFQPSEEGNGGGAKPMIEAGVLHAPAVDAAFGLHVTPDLPSGHIGLRAGPAYASSDRVRITIVGAGGHASRPHLAVDPVLVAAHCIVALQAIASREVRPGSPVVITVGSVQAGTAANIIPAEAELRATVRTATEPNRRFVLERIPEIIQGVCGAFRARADIEIRPGYPVLVNDEEMTRLAEDVAAEVVGPGQVRHSAMRMGAEDMAYFLREVPGTFWRLGVGGRNGEFGHGTHTARFDLDEEALVIGTEIQSRLALRYLAGETPR
jgi:amidohydrolase